MAEKSVPTYHDARLVLKLYELRRDEKLRAARDWYRTKFFPQSFEDVQTVLSPANPDNLSWRMVTSYWDMAASFASHGVLDAELLLESSAEMLLVWSRLEDFIPRLRQEYGPRLLANVEKTIARVPWAAERVKQFKDRLPAFRQALASKR
ncbi:MAG: DUF4760 domain-containing protein [Thermoanaerobaculia bacterium]